MLKFSNSPMVCLKTDEEISKYLFKEEHRLENYPTIPEFYANQEIFITGGSGFIGKVLIEKLLRSCPDLKHIYILLRTKKGASIEDRLKKITDLPLFNPLKSAFPDAINKLIPVEGDITELKMGLSDKDIERMKNVSIIFHSAASVRFDDSLKYAVIMNTRGTREVMRFAESLKNIKVVMHVSTTYSNINRKVIDEKIYPELVSWKKAIEIVEKFDEDITNPLTQMYTDFMPNTYVFSKNLAEHVSYDYKDKVPIVVFRPSIVISAMMEPMAGWVDNFNGPVGLLVGSGLGIVRTMYSNPENRCDFFPVDLCVKGMIIAAWKRGNEPRNTLPVYNCASNGVIRVKIQQVVDIGKGLIERFPLDMSILKPGGCITKNRFINYIKVIFYQLIPALIIDGILKMTGQKTLITKVQRKIFEANLALKYFVMNEWTFKNSNFLALCEEIRLEDLKAFDFRDCLHYDIVTYMCSAILGTKKYLLFDNDKNEKRNKIKAKIQDVFDFILCSIPYMILFYILHSLKIISLSVNIPN